MIAEEKIRALVEEKIGEGPLFIVDITVSAANKIKIELDGDQGISIDDCVAVSRQVEHNLDREQEDFELQVSSAGLGSPLRIERQYHKNLGREVSVLLNDGTERIGRLQAVEDGIRVKLPASKKKKLPEREETYAWDEIKETKVRISFK